MEEIQPLSSPVKQWVLDEPAMSCFHCFISKKKNVYTGFGLWRKETIQERILKVVGEIF